MNDASSTRPVVVAVDGSQAAIGAAAWAAKEALHRGVPLRVVHVVQHTCPSAAAAVLDGAEQEYAQTCLRVACLAVRATDKPITIDAATLIGSVDLALIEESKGASLICVGSSGIGRAAAATHGSTATALAEQARCPVAIIRRLHDRPPAETGFVVAVLDGCTEDDAAIVWALEEGRVRRAPVLALGVFPWPLFDIDDERFYDRLDHWLHRYPDVSVEVATTRLSAPRYLKSFADAVQLVVIGHGDSDSVTRLVGPQQLPILAHANCSVLVARPAEQDDNDDRRLLAPERSAL